MNLAGWYFTNPRAEDCAVITLHGFGGSRAEVLAPQPDLLGTRLRPLPLRRLRPRRQLAVTAQLPRAGAQGPAQGGRLAGGTHGLERSRIGLIVWSYGAATALLTAPEVSALAFVIADSSFSSLHDMARCRPKAIRSVARIFVPGALFVSSVRSGFGRGDAAPVDHIDAVEDPVLLIHSRTDGFTPVGQTEDIYDRSNHERTRVVIPEWDGPYVHSHTEDPLAYTAIVDGFLNDFVRPEFGIRLQR